MEEVWANVRSLSCQYNTPVRVGEYPYGVHGRAAILGASTRAAPALSDGRLYARDGAKLVCVNLK